jgi:hypothetical protein
LVVSQVVHASPPLPQVGKAGVPLHEPPAQQPVPHEEAEQPAQVWAVHVWPPQFWHWAPFWPHAVCSVPLWHSPPSTGQQPLQVVASQ